MLLTISLVLHRNHRNIFRVIHCLVTKRNMVDAASSKGVPLTEVVKKLTDYASPSIAESWDNVGLLVEPSPPHQVKHLFLTNDLTEEVLEEAISNQANLIVPYHPPIFSSVKRITQNRWKDRIVVKCLENRIAIYSPHTSYDVLKGGVNDWLISCFQGDIQPITQLEGGEEGYGQGRICTLHEAMDFTDVCNKVKQHLGLNHVRIGCSTETKKVQTIACCAGSGASVLRGVRADVYLTGEMSHHDVLDAVSNKISVILCEHSNTERGFLKTLLPVLTDLLDSQVTISVSQTDKDPLEVF